MISQPQPGIAAATAATIAVRLVGPDLEHRDAVRPEVAREALEEGPDDGQAVRAAVERGPRLERGGDRQVVHLVRCDVGQVRRDEVEEVTVERQQIGHDELDPVGQAVTHRVLPGELEGGGVDVRGDDPDLVEHPPAAEGGRQGDRHGPAAGPHVGHPKGRRAGRSRGPGQSGHHGRLGDLDQAFRLRVAG